MSCANTVNGGRADYRRWSHYVLLAPATAHWLRQMGGKVWPGVRPPPQLPDGGQAFDRIFGRMATPRRLTIIESLCQQAIADTEMLCRAIAELTAP